MSALILGTIPGAMIERARTQRKFSPEPRNAPVPAPCAVGVLKHFSTTVSSFEEAAALNMSDAAVHRRTTPTARVVCVSIVERAHAMHRKHCGLLIILVSVPERHHFLTADLLLFSVVQPPINNIPGLLTSLTRFS